MKRVFTYMTILACVLSVSCCAEQMETAQESGGYLTITLSSASLETRAEKGGVDGLNENLIETIDWFLYPQGKTGEAAVMKGRIETSRQNIETIRVPVTEKDLNSILFVRPYNTCEVYLIVNLPEDVDVQSLDDTSVGNLRQTAISADFTTAPQKSFVMEGLGSASIIDRKKVIAASGTIPVDRVASKISFNVDVTSTYEDGGNVWTSDPSRMKIAFYHGSNKALLNASPADVAPEYFDVAARPFSVTAGEAEGISRCTCDPFYSYPVSWEVGSPQEPYFLLTLPWSSSSDGSSQFQNCYYKIILSGEELERNTWYDINLSVSVLGSFTEKDPTVLVEDITYYVTDWSTGLDMDANIQGARYLVVEQNSYVLDNEPTLTIPVSSSHKWTITDVSVKHKNLMTGDDVEDTDYTIEPSADMKSVIFTNVLDNDMESPTFDFTQYEIEFTVRHEDNEDFSEKITITQNPAIYAVAEANSNWKGSNSNDVNNSENGYVWVNGYQGYTGNYSRPNNVDYFLSAGGLYNNTSPHMYVFTVTTAKGTDYVIGDPRDTEYTYNSNDARWYNGPAIYDGASNRELNYYYGTHIANDLYTDATERTGRIYADDAAAEAAEPTINMLAPKFRLASGYSVLYPYAESKTLENLKKRCASYQEDGYPAGRWRMPTRAEFQFIMTQVNKGNLPELYYSGNPYWCAHGIGTPLTDGSIKMDYYGYALADDGYSVRCVYDEWYWENSESYRLGIENADGTFTPTDTFTWGDMPRSEFK